MDNSTKMDWFQMALLQAASGKLKSSALYDVVVHSQFATTKPLKATVLANLHLFSSKQQRTIKDRLEKQEVASAERGGHSVSCSRSRSRSRGYGGSGVRGSNVGQDGAHGGSGGAYSSGGYGGGMSMRGCGGMPGSHKFFDD